MNNTTIENNKNSNTSSTQKIKYGVRVICCGEFELMDIKWMLYANKPLIAPCIMDVNNKFAYLITYCPVCGKYIGNMEFKSYSNL
jgi:hypothetical protein